MASVVLIMVLYFLLLFMIVRQLYKSHKQKVRQSEDLRVHLRQKRKVAEAKKEVILNEEKTKQRGSDQKTSRRIIMGASTKGKRKTKT